jgi:hypothetical protein
MLAQSHASFCHAVLFLANKRRCRTRVSPAAAPRKHQILNLVRSFGVQEHKCTKGLGDIMEPHIKAVGVLNIVFGVLGALGGIILLMIFAGITGIVGAATQNDPSQAIALPIIATIGGFLSVILLIVSAPSIIAGIGLLKFRSWARILGIVISVLHLLNFPLGTALGIYGLWVLLSQESVPFFSGRQPAYPPA